MWERFTKTQKFPLLEGSRGALVAYVTWMLRQGQTNGTGYAPSSASTILAGTVVELRDRVPGYAVSLVKAAARLRGCPVGPVRAPLTDPSPADLADLKTLLAFGLDLVGATL